MDTHATLDALLGLPLQPVTALPRLTGLYTLADHEGRRRYIGSTAGKDFRDRIQNRHVTGSEENSHKFSWAYNVGRMWRDRKAADAAEKADGAIAKRFRTAFIRRHCRAAWMPLTLARVELEALERELIRLAPPEATFWNDKRLVRSPVEEPAKLVSRLIDELRMPPAEREALGRQAARYSEAADCPSD